MLRFECGTDSCSNTASIIHPWLKFKGCLLDVCDKQTENTNQPSSTDGWMKSCFWWDTGWWLVAVPSLGTAFYRALNRASTHVFLERLALTFRLIIAHNQQLCSHYFSPPFLIQTCRFFVFSVFCLCMTYVRANKSPNGNHYTFHIYFCMSALGSSAVRGIFLCAFDGNSL